MDKDAPGLVRCGTPPVGARSARPPSRPQAVSRGCAPDPAASRAAYRSHPPDGQCSLIPPLRLSPAGPHCWARPGYSKCLYFSCFASSPQRFCSVFLIQLQHRHKRLRRHLHAAQAAHLFLAAPQRFPFAGIPIFFACSGGVNPPSAKVLPSAKRLHALTRAPPPGAPEGAKKLRPQFSSSSLSTAMNASVGICTLPRLRIFFLPSFCFSSSFFFRVISPP